MQIGDVLNDRYRIASEGKLQDIGTLYDAYDGRYERTVAILVLTSRYAGDGDTLRRFVQGQQAVIDLAVPEVVPAEDAGLVGGQSYLVRSLVDGHTLADLQARIGPLASDVAVQISIRLCDALAPLHRAGLIHGGLSPYSVLVQDGGQVLVTDVGLLPALRPVFAPPGTPWGRVPYLSPEQAAGEDVRPSSDVYVVGSLLYTMLTGRPPFRAQDEAVLAVRHLRHDPPSLHVLAPDAPPRLVEIVQKALAKEPAARYRNAGQLAYILRAHLDTQPPGPPRPTRPIPVEAEPRPRRRPVHPTQALPPEVEPRPRRRPAHPTTQVLSPEAEPHPRQRLIVPAPPSAGIYPPDTDVEDWPEEPATADWLMVALVVAALVAVLGLIPLWRTVYRRYAPPPALHRSFQGDWAWLSPRSGGVAGETITRSKLDDFGLVWYNLSIANQPVFWSSDPWPRPQWVKNRLAGSPDLGPRLRDSGAIYSILCMH